MFPGKLSIVHAQALVLPDFSAAPEWAQGILYAVLAVGLALTVLIPRFGFLAGRDTVKAAANGTAGAGPLVVAAVADPTALNNLANAILTVGPALVAHGKQLEEHGEALTKLREEMIRESGRKRD